MSDKVLISAGVASALFVLTSPVIAKEKAKNTTATTHVYSQVECTKMKNMHWDDATQTCQKNK
jgi:hypothetical protein